MLSSGIPTREEYLRLESEPLYAELLSSSQEFENICSAGGESTRSFRKKWVQDPFQQWSRRWEYVYVAQRLSEWASSRPGLIKVVDAGSGFTFYPFYLGQAISNLEVHCYDNDPTAGAALQEVGEDIGAGPAFQLEDLERLSREDETVDAVYSVSVIEHTKTPGKVVDEINRILKPGGIFICTFDISFETRSPMYYRQVEKLVNHITDVFDVPQDWKTDQFESLPTDADIVSTSWDLEAVKAGLPWRNPLLVWLYDLVRGRFRRALYRPLTFCCLTLNKEPK